MNTSSSDNKQEFELSSVEEKQLPELSAEEALEGADLMEAAFQNFEAPKEYKVGDKATFQISSIEGLNVFFDVGAKGEGIMLYDELKESLGREPQVGDSVEAIVLRSSFAGLELGMKLPGKEQALLSLEQALEDQLPVEGKVTGKNKGGLEVSVFGKRAFCPISQVELRFCENPEQYIGQKLLFRVTELKKGGKNIVLSRKALLQEKLAETMAEMHSELEAGKEFDGTVKKLEKFGAFVDIGSGVEGLLHISEISHRRIEDPNEELEVGQKIRVAVKSFNQDTKKLSLSMKSLQEHPWDAYVSSIHDGATVEGTVVRMKPFGAFINLSDGVDGFVHVSELSHQRVKHPKEIVEEGARVELKVINIDRDKRKIGLSIKQMDMTGAPKAADGSIGMNSLAEVTIEQYEDFGIFVKFEDGQRGLLPKAEIDAPKNADLTKLYPLESKIEVLVLNVDVKNNRIRVSHKAAAKKKEQMEYNEFVQMQEKDQSEGFGTFGDLLSKAKKDA